MCDSKRMRSSKSEPVEGPRCTLPECIRISRARASAAELFSSGPFSAYANSGHASAKKKTPKSQRLNSSNEFPAIKVKCGTQPSKASHSGSTKSPSNFMALLQCEKFVRGDWQVSSMVWASLGLFCETAGAFPCWIRFPRSSQAEPSLHPGLFASVSARLGRRNATGTLQALAVCVAVLVVKALASGVASASADEVKRCVRLRLKHLTSLEPLRNAIPSRSPAGLMCCTKSQWLLWMLRALGTLSRCVRRCCLYRATNQRRSLCWQGPAVFTGLTSCPRVICRSSARGLFN